MTMHRTMSGIALALTLVLTACSGGEADTAAEPLPVDPSAEQTDTGGDPVEEPDESVADCEVGTDCEAIEDEVVSGACAIDQPDCLDTLDEPDPAAGSCLVGDEDCTDESFGGQDVTTVVPVTDSVSTTANVIAEGTSSGATGRVITAAAVDGTSLRLVVDGGACDVLEDVLVDESPEAVRVLVLTGQDAQVEMCTQQIVSWAVDVQLETELGDRTLLDLAG